MQKLPRKITRTTGALRLALLFAGSLALLGVFSVGGIIGSADHSLQRAYYRVRGETSPPASVILVALDEDTAEHWDHPPWSAERINQLIGAVLAGSPKIVAVVEGTGLFAALPGNTALPKPRSEPGSNQSPNQSGGESPNQSGGESPDKSNDETENAIDQALASGQLIVPKRDTGGLAQPALRIGSGPVESVGLTTDGGVRSVLGRVIDRIDHPLATGEILAVNYGGPPDSLPTISAHRITSGQIPATAFTDRVVLIGAQGRAFAPLLPTPVGPMSPAEIQAYALAGLTAGNTWQPFPLWLYWLLLAFSTLALLVVIPRLKTGAIAVTTAVLVLAIIGVDYWLFTSGTTVAGASGFVMAIAVAKLACFLSERQRTRHELAEFARWLADRADDKLQSGSLCNSDDDYLSKFLKASRTYIDFHSAVFAELPQGSHHLELRHYIDTKESEILERRRDVRREPYNKAYRTHRPEWATRPFMENELELKTLMVPLVELGRILGYWIVNFPKASKVSRRKVELCATLGNQASIALDRRRLQQKNRLRDGRQPMRSPTVLLGQLRDMRQAAASMVQSHHRTDELLENLPVGVLVASLWGEIELVNAAMRRHLQQLGVEDPRRMTLPDLVAEISGAEAGEVREKLRRIMGEQNSVNIAHRSGSERALSIGRELVLSRVSGVLGGDGAGAADDESGNRAAHFVLTASESAHVAWSDTARHSTAPAAVEAERSGPRLVSDHDRAFRHGSEVMRVDAGAQGDGSRHDGDDRVWPLHEQVGLATTERDMPAVPLAVDGMDTDKEPSGPVIADYTMSSTGS